MRARELTDRQVDFWRLFPNVLGRRFAVNARRANTPPRCCKVAGSNQSVGGGNALRQGGPVAQRGSLQLSLRRRPVKALQQQMIQQKSRVEGRIAEMNHFKIDGHHVGRAGHQKIFRTPVAMHQRQSPRASEEKSINTEKNEARSGCRKAVVR